MTTIRVELQGQPVAKGRPRFARQGRTYTPAKTREAEARILNAWRMAAGNRAPHSGPVTVELIATFTPAQSWPAWKRDLAHAGEWPHTQRPDIDNLLKVIDGLNGSAWLDDSQITAASVIKKFGTAPSTVLLITLHPAETTTKEKSTNATSTKHV